MTQIDPAMTRSERLSADMVALLLAAAIATFETAWLGLIGFGLWHVFA